MNFKIPEKYRHYNGWTLDANADGAIYYHKGDRSIYCTPNWESVDGLTLEIFNYCTDESNRIHLTDKKIKSAKQWFALISFYLSEVK